MSMRFSLIGLCLAVSTAVPLQAQVDRSVSQPEPLTAPDSWITPRDYPDKANDRDETVEVSLRVGADGRVAECWLRRRAQFQMFNDLTCQLLVARARFRPARNAAGDAVTGDYRYSVRWAPEQPDPAATFGP